METWYYTVIRIEGDYAYLQRTDIELDDEKCVALALLPSSVNEGSNLKYEFLQYSLC